MQSPPAIRHWRSAPPKRTGTMPPIGSRRSSRNTASAEVGTPGRLTCRRRIACGSPAGVTAPDSALTDSHVAPAGKNLPRPRVTRHDSRFTPHDSSVLITIRDLHSLKDYTDCVAIQEATWGAGFAERVPTAILRVGQKIGGVSAGAFDENGRMVGFVFGLTGVR